MRKRIKYLIACFFFFILSSCRKDADYIAPITYPNTPQGNFDAFWNGIDQNYIFFPFDPIDWNSMYSTYKPRVNDLTTPKQLESILVNMFNPLIDGHKELKAIDTIGTYNQGNYFKRYPYYNPQNIAVNSYLDTSSISVIGSEGVQEIITGVPIGTRIIYLQFRAFKSGLQKDTASFFDTLFNIAQKNAYGLILDLRHNGGGEATEIYSLLSRFVSSNYTWGYSQLRLQRDRYTLSPPIPQNVNPNPINYSKKLVILTDRYSFSAAEITTLALKGLPNVTVMGDTTGGANGPISDSKDYTGDFTLPNGWTVQLAQQVTLDKNKKLYEGKGVPPDVVVKQDQNQLQQGKDNVLQTAIDFINQ